MGATSVHVIGDVHRAATVLHPLRLRILGELGEPESAAGLARRIGIPRQLVNYHLRQLESDGLVELAGERRKRNCTERLVRAVARSYVISPAALGRLSVDPEQVPDRASSAYLVAVAARLIADLADQRTAAERAGKQLATLTMEAEVRFASPAAQRGFVEELTNVVAALVARYNDDAVPNGRRFRFIVGGHPAPAVKRPPRVSRTEEKTP